jgi:hypothetical protein
MPAKKKNIQKPGKAKGKRRKRISLDASNILIVKHTVEKGTLFPKKLKKMNKMLGNAVLLD